MLPTKKPTIWLVVGSQHLYGDDVLAQVARHAGQMTTEWNASGRLALPLVCKPVMTGPESITTLMADANSDPDCGGVICWMHTFSPSKMWIRGLRILRKPLLHLHTQFNEALPWSEIDMDFMNLNQAAHGDREHGFIHARMRRPRKLVVGHWRDERVSVEICRWMRAARAWADAQGMRIARIGDNMREVAVTEGDKVEAEMVFGYAVNGYGLGDLVKFVDEVTDSEVDRLVSSYQEEYTMRANLRPGGERHRHVRDAARIECGLRAFLSEGGFRGFTTTFENLHGLKQLPGIAVQRLMHDGFGFGAEGDWKTAALLRSVKVMGEGLAGGSSFMEDYTYHMTPGEEVVLGAHMLEICPSLAAGRPSLEVHPLGIGGKDDPARLVFNSGTGSGLNVAIMDMGNRFRLLVNTVEVIAAPMPLPKLPVARAVWKPNPDFQTALAAWIHAGGAHHTAFSLAIDSETIRDFALIAGVELLEIDKETRLERFIDQIRLNEILLAKS